MSSEYVFEMRIPDDILISFEQDATYPIFLGQFQPYAPMIVCLINNKMLKYYNKNGPFPANIRFDHKEKCGNILNYYFQDINDNTMYCIFTRNMAKLFYPQLSIIDPDSSDKKTVINIRNINKPVNSKIIKSLDGSELTVDYTIVDKDGTYSFPNFKSSVNRREIILTR